MNNLDETLKRFLEEANYKTAIYQQDGIKFTAFENRTLFGFIFSYDTPANLIKNWESDKSKALRLFAQKFHSAGTKAWNVYSVFLTQQNADETQYHRLQDIEEDLRETRKIARSNIQTSDDLRAALLTLLPFSYIPSLPPLDIQEEIKKRAGDIPGEVLDAFFSNKSNAEIIDLLENI